MALRIDDKYARLQNDLAATRAKITELEQLAQRIIGALLILDELPGELANGADAEQSQSELPQ